MNITLNEEQHLDLFWQVINLLAHLEDDCHAFSVLADEAGIHVSTLYNWVNLRVKCPQLRTLFNVAWCLGYEVVLQKRKVRLQEAA